MVWLIFSVMSELLFEGYHVPGVCYGIDFLLSYSCSNNPCRTAMIISVGYHCTHVIPVLDSKIDTARCKRIDVGGYHITNFLYKMLQLKYPGHLNAITPSRAEVIFVNHSSSFSPNIIKRVIFLIKSRESVIEQVITPNFYLSVFVKPITVEFLFLFFLMLLDSHLRGLKL